MTDIEAIKARHSVRKYTDKPIETEKVDALRAETEKTSLSGRLVFNAKGISLGQTLPRKLIRR